jgi:polysaccharide pyruvyl transferase WcaK-like protein
MRRQGVDTSGDQVYPDLAFVVPVPSAGPGDEQTVGVGLIDYYGNNDDHARPGDIHARYVEKMKSFTRWLVDNGRRVRLFVGDTNNADQHVVEEILADLRAYRPDLDPAWVVAEPVVTFADLARAMAPAGLVVATRYHNVICALMLSKPTISIGYGEKNAVLMAGTGLAEYCQSVNSLDLERLIKQLTDLENQAPRLRQTITAGNAAKAPLIERQLAEVSAVLFPASGPGSEPGGPHGRPGRQLEGGIRPAHSDEAEFHQGKPLVEAHRENPQGTSPLSARAAIESALHGGYPFVDRLDGYLGL